MLEELTALAQIADIDTKALQAEAELKEIPERIAAMDADIKRLSELLESERQQLAEAERLLAAQDDEIANQNQALAKSKSKSAHARTTREADAVERELEVVRRTLKDRETERDTLRTAIDSQQKALAKREQDFQQLQEVVGKEKAAANERLQVVQALHEQVVSGRGTVAAKISGPVLRRYDLIRSRRGVGVSAIKAGCCVGCNVSLAPQIVIKVQRGETLEQCPNCQRFLYARSVVEGDSTEA